MGAQPRPGELLNLPPGTRLDVYSVAAAAGTVWRVTYTPQSDVALTPADWGLADSHSRYVGEMSDALRPVDTLVIRAPRGPLLVGHAAPAAFGGAITKLTVSQPHRTMIFDLTYCVEVVNSRSNFRCNPATREVVFAWPLVPGEAGQIIVEGDAPAVTRDFVPDSLQPQAALP